MPASNEAEAELRLGLGFLFEHWIDFPTFGARALGELDVRPWAAGLALGGLAGPKQDDVFVPTEWHAFVFGTFDARSLGGLRLGAGVASPLWS